MGKSAKVWYGFHVSNEIYLFWKIVREPDGGDQQGIAIKTIITLNQKPQMI